MGCRQAVRHQTLTLALVGSNPAIPARKKHLRKQVLFSTKFALRASEIASLWNICSANVKYSLTRMWANFISHCDRREQYFTMCDSTLFHIRHRRIFHPSLRGFHRANHDFIDFLLTFYWVRYIMKQVIKMTVIKYDLNNIR